MFTHHTYATFGRGVVFCLSLMLLPFAPAGAQTTDLSRAHDDYKTGRYDSALVSFRRGADAGLGEAQHWLGLMYDRGHGVERNQQIAYQWFGRAAEQGYPEAQRVIGVYLEDGTVVAQDLVAAASWYRRAAN